jgi:hypothetical protein
MTGEIIAAIASHRRAALLAEASEVRRVRLARARRDEHLRIRARGGVATARGRSLRVLLAVGQTPNGR